MPGIPTSTRGAATSRRILDAAAAEFAERGIAGARIDRITEAAQTNKAQVYGYFGSKEGLFDAVIAERIDDATDAVPFTIDDLPGWAVTIYDRHLACPDLARLITWMRLERRPTGRWFDGDRHEPKIEAIAEAQAGGRIRSGDPAALLTLIMGMASAWSPSSSVYTASADEPESEHGARRSVLRAAVAAAIAPDGA